MTEALKTDIAIIGAGPVGLFAVFEAGMLGMRAAVIDALDMLGGQCAALYPEKPIYDIPGFPQILAQDLIKNLEAQAAPFHPQYLLGSPVIHLERIEDGFHLRTSVGQAVDCKAVIIAAGAGAFGPNRPPLPDIDHYEGRSVFYYVKRREDFRNKRIIIAGGGDSAVDWALSLAEVAAHVSVVHRRDVFRAAPESERQLRELSAQGRIDLVTPYQLHALEGRDGWLRAVHLRDLDGQERRIEADFLLTFFGLAMTLGPIANWGLALHHKHLVVNATDMATSVEGIYAIGDVATYPKKLKLILTGFAEAAQAMHAAYDRVFPGKALHFEYSTSKGLNPL